LAECFRCFLPFSASLVQHSKAELEVGQIGMLANKLVVLRDRLILVSLFGHNIGHVLLQIRRIGKAFIAYLDLANSLLGAQNK
jgi:hypothetical protein